MPNSRDAAFRSFPGATNVDPATSRHHPTDPHSPKWGQSPQSNKKVIWDSILEIWEDSMKGKWDW
jgi:hypothetical protein